MVSFLARDADVDPRNLTSPYESLPTGQTWPGAVTARKDDAPAAVQAAIANVVGLGSASGGGGLIQTTSG